MLSVFPAKIATLPGRYLGLPLHFRRLKGVDLQSFIDRFAGRLPGWKGKLLNKPGRVAVAQSVPTAMATFHITTLNLSKGTLRKIDKIIRAFIWQKEDQAQTLGGQSLVNWKTGSRPRHLGGLGIMDLERFGRALCLRWPWLQWTDPDRPWVGSELPCDQADLNLFRACTTISLGNGKKALFWHDNWSGKGPLKLIAPELFKIAPRKNRTVHEELSNESWIRAVSSLRSMHQLGEFVSIWEWISQATLLPTNEDHISWNLTTKWGLLLCVGVWGAILWFSS